MNRKITKFCSKLYLQDINENIDLREHKKRKLIKGKLFRILKFNEYLKLLDINYNVIQLKTMCRHYKQTVYGNKTILVNRIFNYLKLSHNVTRIQKYIRGYQRRLYFKLSHIKQFKKIVNETDFLTLRDIHDIPYYQIFCLKDADGFVHGFDIKSLYNLLIKSDSTSPLKNPYNRKELSKKTIDRIYHFIKLSHVLKEPIMINLKDETTSMSQKKRIELKALSIFQRMDSFGYITDVDWFLSLNKLKLIRFYNELKDIWYVRANLNITIKMQICPPSGNPFENTTTTILIHQDIKTTQQFILHALENIIYKGIDTDSQALGVCYVLTAFTLVNHSAAIALPWFYESVV